MRAWMTDAATRLGGYRPNAPLRARDRLPIAYSGAAMTPHVIASTRMRSIVTGGAGFIGSNLVDALVKREDEVLVVDDLSTGKEQNLADAAGSGATLVRGDIAAPGVVAEQVDGFRPDRIFHLAAQADVRKSNADPVFDARVNLIGTINVLEAARRRFRAGRLCGDRWGGLRRGGGRGSTVPGDRRARPGVRLWSQQARGGELRGLYRRLNGVPGLALRLGNVYGPRQDPHGEAGVVAIFCGRLLAGERPKVFGDGLQTRDFVFVDDVVAALVAASDALAEGGTESEGRSTWVPARRPACSICSRCSPRCVGWR